MTDADRDLLSTAVKGDNELIKKSLSAGAEINTSDPAGKTSLIQPAGYNHFDSVKLLLEKKADPALKMTSGPYQGNTAAQFAEKNEHFETAEFLKKIIL